MSAQFDEKIEKLNTRIMLLNAQIEAIQEKMTVRIKQVKSNRDKLLYQKNMQLVKLMNDSKVPTEIVMKKLKEEVDNKKMKSKAR